MYCGNSYEIASHDMGDCPRAMSILLNVVNYSSHAGFFESTMERWIEMNMLVAMGRG